MKQVATKMLFIWLASWTIVTLQPCCESILQPPDSHHQSQDNHHHSDAHGDHHASVDSNHHDSNHDCRVALENLDDLAVPVTDDFSANYQVQLDDTTVIPTIRYQAQLNNVLISFGYHYNHPPPGTTKLYLSTLRIRV